MSAVNSLMRRAVLLSVSAEDDPNAARRLNGNTNLCLNPSKVAAAERTGVATDAFSWRSAAHSDADFGHEEQWLCARRSVLIAPTGATTPGRSLACSAVCLEASFLRDSLEIMLCRSTSSPFTSCLRDTLVA